MEGDVPIFLSALSDRAVYQTFNKRSGNGRTIPRLDLRFFWKRPEKIDGVSLSSRGVGTADDGETVMAELFQEAGPSHLFRARDLARLGYSPAPTHALARPSPFFLSVISIKRHVQLRIVANSITTSPLVRGERAHFFSLFN